MGLFSKLFGTSEDEPTPAGDTEEANARKPAEAHTSGLAASSDENHGDSDAKAPTPSATNRAEHTAETAESASTHGSKVGARSAKVSEAIRRRRTQTTPGVAPPSPPPPAGATGKATQTTPLQSPKPVGVRRRSSRWTGGASVSPVGDAQPNQGDLLLDAMGVRTLQAFAVDLSLGPVTTRWRDPVVSAAQALSAQLQETGHPELSGPFDELAERVQNWPTFCGATTATQRDEALARCAALRLRDDKPLIAPEELLACEHLLVEQVLLKAGDAGPLVLERLREAELLSVSGLAAADSAVLALRARVDTATAARMKAALSDFLDSRSDELQTLVQERPTRHFTRLANRLASLDRKYQAACDADDAETKRSTRLERSQEVMTLKLTLAQLGKPAFVRDVERMSTAQKADTVRRWLAEGHL